MILAIFQKRLRNNHVQVARNHDRAVVVLADCADHVVRLGISEQDPVGQNEHFRLGFCRDFSDSSALVWNSLMYFIHCASFSEDFIEPLPA